MVHWDEIKQRMKDTVEELYNDETIDDKQMHNAIHEEATYYATEKYRNINEILEVTLSKRNLVTQSPESETKSPLDAIRENLRKELIEVGIRKYDELKQS